ncbi:hypothetical protein ALO73_200140 [Pseudomonas syringae pv. daphniphylli]|uniref:DNA-binding protein n=1 Tax=Pseudomonas syringae pv. daphniphylli TaxID=264455 RepID=A0A9X0H450_PSESX|nr:hypothetical protein ALO73_200140 [Pseudomonas syringae pv. daphniphylli]
MCKCGSCHRAPMVMHHVVYSNREHRGFRYVRESNLKPVSRFVSQESIESLSW